MGISGMSIFARNLDGRRRNREVGIYKTEFGDVADGILHALSDVVGVVKHCGRCRRLWTSSDRGRCQTLWTSSDIVGVVRRGGLSGSRSM